MFHLLVYDIEDNKIRTKIAKIVERAGGTRIQKSVWIIDLNEGKKLNLRNDLQDLLHISPNQDSILIFPLEKDHITQTLRIGDNPAFEEAVIQINTLFF
jgi:CRISPR-associated protein Cas2